MSTTFADPVERAASILSSETLPGRGTFYIATNLGDIITHAAAVLDLSATEQKLRMRAHANYVNHIVNKADQHAATAAAQEANASRMHSRYLLGQNQLFGYTIQSDDILRVWRPDPTKRDNNLAHVHAEQHGLTVVGHQLHFGVHNQPEDEAPLVYLTESDPYGDMPSGIEVGIPVDRLQNLHALSRARAQQVVTSVGQLAIPTGPTMYALHM